MKRKYVLIGMAVLLAAAGTLLAQARFRHAHFGYGWHGRGPEAMIGRLTKVFDLTDAQQAEVKSMWQQEKPVVMPMIQQLVQGRKQMMAATANGTFDQAKVRDIANEQAQTIATLMVEKEKMTTQFYNLLTPEQRTKFDRIRQHRSERIDKMLGRISSAKQ